LLQDSLSLLVDLLDSLILALIEGLGITEGKEYQHVKHSIFNDLGGKGTIWRDSHLREVFAFELGKVGAHHH
jgi:hypothetical protein